MSYKMILGAQCCSVCNLETDDYDFYMDMSFVTTALTVKEV